MIATGPARCDLRRNFVSDRGKLPSAPSTQRYQGNACNHRDRAKIVIKQIVHMLSVESDKNNTIKKLLCEKKYLEFRQPGNKWFVKSALEEKIVGILKDLDSNVGGGESASIDEFTEKDIYRLLCSLLTVKDLMELQKSLKGDGDLLTNIVEETLNYIEKFKKQRINLKFIFDYMSNCEDNYNRIIKIFDCKGDWKNDKDVLKDDCSNNDKEFNVEKYIFNNAVALKIRTPLDMTGVVDKGGDKLRLGNSTEIISKIQEAYKVANDSRPGL